MITVKYTKAQYQAKITELEGYYNQLNQHLEKMKELKEQLFKFWNDANAQTTGQLLAAEIRKVQTAMDRTSDSITMFKAAIDGMDGVNFSIGDILGDALNIVGG